MNDSTALDGASIQLTIPCKAEFVGVARLVVVGVASRMSFAYDELEDLRLAIGEACTGVISRARLMGGPVEDIRIRCTMDPPRLTIAITDSVTPGSPGAVEPGEEASIGQFLIEILVDECSSHSDGRGTTLTLIKSVGRQAS